MDETNIEKTEENSQFEKLTPIEIDKLGVYEDAMDFAFKDNSKDDNPIKNIAISGPYGAGKSSLLYSYKKKNKKMSFIHISLAHFKTLEEKTEKTDLQKEGIKKSTLETKILNQLLHQIPTEKITQTNFRVKNKINKKNIIRTSITIVVFLIMMLHLFFFSGWKDYILSFGIINLPYMKFVNWFLELTISPYIQIVDGVAIICILTFSIYKLIVAQQSKSILKKINLQGNEIDLFDGNEDSYFDKYLNEVLYLFENSGANVIVFEDLDRFNVSQIFERLHEINTLVNIQNEKNHKPVLKFCYLLRDDLFISKDRTKFFDYIVPVIPVMDSSNSYDQFIKHFKNNDLFEKFDDFFLQKLSLYIDDMRVLKNINNEFLIYYKKLNITELDCNKMLAIIAYKNLFPRDFSELQLNKGFVFTLLNDRELLIKSEREQIDLEIAEIDKNIVDMEKEHLEGIKELKLVFDEKKTNYPPRLRPEDEKSFKKRAEVLKKKSDIGIEKCKENIVELEIRKIVLNNKSLEEIITSENKASIFSIIWENEVKEKFEFKDVKGNEYFALLKYLLSNGYINETYSDYMTYFYGNSLIHTDKIFLRSIFDKKAKKYFYKLSNPEKVVSMLQLNDFKEIEILNFDLLEYLLNSSENEIYLIEILKQIKEQEKFKFIGAFYDISENSAKFIIELTKIWLEMIEVSIENKFLTEKQINNMSIDILCSEDEEILSYILKSKILAEYISKTRDYLETENENAKIIEGLNLLDVKFISLNYENSNKNLFKEVYKNNLYKINKENIEMMFNIYYPDCEKEKLYHENYTLVFNNTEQPISIYINDNIELYMELYLGMCGGYIKDSENALVSILNNEIVIKEQKQQYIKLIENTISTLKLITDKNLWKDLVFNKTIEYSEENIVEYYSYTSNIDESLSSFINEGSKKLNFSKITESNNEIYRKLFNSVVVSKTITVKKYKEILLSLNFEEEKFNDENLETNKLEILIDEKIIIMNEENLEFIRENYSNNLIRFIESNIEEYIDILKDVELPKDELLKILELDIEDDKKIKLLKISQESISIIDKKYSDKILEHIINNNAMDSDFKSLFKTYDDWKLPIKDVIENKAIEQISLIVAEPEEVSKDLKEYLLSKESILSSHNKIALFISMMPVLDVGQIKEKFLALGLTKYLEIFMKNKKPKFHIDENSNKLLEALKVNGKIKEYNKIANSQNYSVQKNSL